MKNADEMLKDIVKKVDTSGDGKIQYEGVIWFILEAQVLGAIADSGGCVQNSGPSSRRQRSSS